MFASRRFRKIVAGGLLPVATGFLSTSPAKADGYGYCQPLCHYTYVTVYVPRTVSYTTCVIRYDHCGQPYRVAQTCYKTIQVPVQKRVLVCDTESPSGY